MMHQKTDIIIIGAGILGCFAARALSRYDLQVTVLEKKADVCTEISKANTGIIYQGYDQHPGSLKAALCQKASRAFPQLCKELDVPYKKRGLLMLSFGSNADRVLEKKVARAQKAAIDHVRLIDAEEIYRLEPALRAGAKHALFAEDTCVVNPWELGIAAYENAAANGVSFCFNEEVLQMRKEAEGFCIETSKQTHVAKCVLCCGGFSSDALWEKLQKPRVRLIPQAADYLIFDTYAGDVISHVLSVEPEEKGEGLTVVPTVNGNLMVGPTRRDSHCLTSGETALSGICELKEKAKALLPDLPLEHIIRSFGAARPNPFAVDEDGNPTDKSLQDFVILEEDGLFALIGVKTPGITCADKLGSYIAERIINALDKKPSLNPAFSPLRKAIIRTDALLHAPAQLSALPAAYQEIFCRCKNVSKGEIIEAIARGATTVDGIKRRTGAGMGRCQGGFCTEKIVLLLSETLGISPYDITKDGAGTELLQQ